MPTAYYWLSTHLSYRCRHTGACCTAGWPIPIERERAVQVQAGIAAGAVRAPAVWLTTAAAAPPEVAGILARTPSGACVFHQGRRDGDQAPRAGGCAIHPWRPSACAHFPYVCVTDARGVHVTLSHYCPTAASLLFDSDGPPRVVPGPPVFEDGSEPEGLDAREALPPAAPVSPPRLLTWAEVSAWEHALVARLAGDRRVPEPPSEREFDRARAAVPPPWTWPAAPADVGQAWRDRVAPAWSAWAPVVGRYLAAKAHASWAMCLGGGPADVERGVALARTVLQVEAVRACRESGAALSRAVLLAAIRRSDLLLVHLADPARLFGAR